MGADVDAGEHVDTKSRSEANMGFWLRLF